MEEVIDRCRGLSIEEEEDIQGGEPEQQETTKWVLVGRFLTDCPVNSQEMESTR